MPLPLIPLLGIGAAGGGAVLYVRHKKKNSGQPAASSGATSKLGATSSSPPPWASIQKAADAVGGAAGEVASYVKILDTASKIETLGVGASGGNKAQEDTARVGGFLGGGGGVAGAGGLGTGIAIGLVSRNLSDSALKSLGVNDYKTRNTLAQSIGIAAGVGSVAGPCGVVVATGVELVAQGGSALYGAVFGHAAEQKLRNQVREFDPTASGTAASKVVGKVTDAINSIFGGGKKAPAPPPTTAAGAAAFTKGLKQATASGGNYVFVLGKGIVKTS